MDREMGKTVAFCSALHFGLYIYLTVKTDKVVCRCVSLYPCARAP